MFPIMNVPFPLFPARFFPSLVPCQKQSVVLVTHPSPLLSKSVHSLPSSSLPTVPCPLSLLTIMFLPSFPIDDYVPAPFPYFRLSPWHSLSLMFLCYMCRLLKVQLCIKCLSEQARQLLSMHKIMFQIPTLFLMQKSPFKWKVLEPL
jgi:hypothetical protein